MKLVTTFLIIVLLVLISCDFYGTYNFVVENKFSEPIYLYVKTEYNDSIHDNTIKLSVADTLLILTTGTENLGMNEQPHGIYKDRLSVFDSLILTDGSNKHYNIDLKQVKYWTFQITGDQEGTYKLIIDSTLLK